jgi:hypothetical protein
MVDVDQILVDKLEKLQAARPDTDDGRNYRLSFRDFGKGRAEFTVTVPYYNSLDAQLRSAFPREKRELSEEEKARLSLARAVRRARQRVRWLVKACEANHLLTLTYRENMQDVVRLASDWKRFVRLVRQRFPQWVYVMVRERQERGALHVHAAVVGRQDVRFLRECWLQVVGNDNGNIDVRGPKKRWGNESDRWNPHRLSSYMCKYMSKDFEAAEQEKKRYWASRGIEMPPKRVYWLGATNFPAAVAEVYDYVRAVGCKQTSVWASDDWRCIWVDASG